MCAAKRKTGENNFDIVIIGAGPVGLSFARGLSGRGLKIALVEKSDIGVLSNPPYDGREIALTHLSHRIMKDSGSLDFAPPNAISLITDAAVLNGESSYVLNFSHDDTGKDNLGFMMSNQAIRKAAFDAVADVSGIDLMTGVEVTNVESDSFCATVALSDGRTLKASLAVAADSRFSPTRKMMGIPVETLDFRRTCIVCRMGHEKPHDRAAYECFHYGRTLAVLPLNNNHSSIVITLPTEESAAVLALTPEEFAQDIERRIDSRLGGMSLASKLYPYPLVATYARKFYAKRFALIGDAAVGMHPVTAHGFNLGLRGQHTLAQEIVAALDTGMDIGSAEVLRRYDRQHRLATRPLYLGTNALVRLYTKETPPARLVRHALLRLGNRIGPAKRLIMDQLTEIKSA